MIQKVILFSSLLLPESPLHACQASIQQYFKNITKQSLIEQQLPPIIHGFEPKPFPKDTCTNIIKQGNKYYYCRQCARNRGHCEMIYCSQCFEENLHKEHSFQQRVAKAGEDCTCDCGRQLLLNKQTFCKNHSSKTQQQSSKLEIDQQGQNKFIQYFSNLINIMLYLKEKNEQKIKIVQILIAKTLLGLCEKSLYYVKMTTKLLQNKLTKTYNHSYQNTVQQILEQHHQFIPVLFQLMGDKQYLLKFGQYFQRMEDEGNIHQFYMGDLRYQLLNSADYLKKYAKQGKYFPEVIQNYFSLLQQSDFDINYKQDTNLQPNSQKQPTNQKQPSKIGQSNKQQQQTSKQKQTKIQSDKISKVSRLLMKISQNTNTEQLIDILFTIFREGSSKLIEDSNFQSIALNIIINYFINPEPQEPVQIPAEKMQNQKKEQQKKQQKSEEPKTQTKAQQKVEPKQQNKQKEIKTLSKQQKLKLRKCLSIITNILLKKCNNKIEKFSQAVKLQFYNSDVNSNSKKSKNLSRNLQYMVQLVFQNALFLSFKKTKLSQIMLLILTVLETHPKKQDLLLKLWNEVIQHDNTSFYENLEKVYDLIGFLCTLYKKHIIFATDQSQQILKSSEIQLKQSVLKSYLYQNKEISNKSLWADYSKKGGWMNFSSCPTVLNQYSKFNNAHDTFVFRSEKADAKKLSNRLLKLPNQTNRSAENVRNLDIQYDSGPFCNSKTLKSYLLTLFKTQQFYNALQFNFIRGLETVQKQARSLERWKQKGVGQFYVILLLIINKLCGGQQHPLIKQQIQKIRLNLDQYRFRFTQIGSQEKIKKILCVDQPVQIPAEEQQQQLQNSNPNNDQPILQKSEQQIRRQQLLQKSKLRKQQIRQKMKKKRGNMLDKMKKQSSVVQEQQQNFCLSCKQREKKDNYFVVLINISNQDLISKTLHTSQSKSSLKICTNLHLVHIQCYKKIKKKQMSFSCPLCKQQINCYLPYKLNKVPKSALNTCWNVMNAALVCSCQIYETGSIFSVLIDCLVESLGFKELVVAKKSKNSVKYKKKVDTFIIQTLSYIHSLASQSQKQKYRQIYNEYKQKIKTCTQKETEFFQQVILQAIYFRISGQQEIDPALLQNLSKMMIEEQFKILMQTLQFITEGNSDALSSISGISLQKISQQQIGQNQQKFEEKEDKVSLQKIQQTQSIGSQNSSSAKLMVQPNLGQNQLQQRKILGIHIFTPPKTIKQFLTLKFLKSINCTKCSNCQSAQLKILCLICRKVFCGNCTQNEIHSQMHLGKYITIGLESTRIFVQTKQNTQKYDIYFNPFMIEYKLNKTQNDNESQSDEIELSVPIYGGGEQKQSDIKNGNQLQYTLNEVKLAQIMNNFYNLQGN